LIEVCRTVTLSPEQAHLAGKVETTYEFAHQSLVFA
jgi:hypothetical protein